MTDRLGRGGRGEVGFGEVLGDQGDVRGRGEGLRVVSWVDGGGEGVC